MDNSFDSKISPEVCPTANEVIQNALDAAREILDGLDPVETIIALVTLQLFVEVNKTFLTKEELAADWETLEQSSVTTFPIIEEDDGEE